MIDPFAIIVQTEELDLQGVVARRSVKDFHIYDFTSAGGVECSITHGGDDNWIQVAGLTLPSEIIRAIGQEIEGRYS